MMIYTYLLLAISVLFCITSFVTWMYRLRRGKMTDYAKAKGSVNEGIVYSYTVAMLPQHKESAFLHLPTYTAGIIYHLGTFTAFLILALTVFFPELLLSPFTQATHFNGFITKYANYWTVREWLRLILGVVVTMGSLCGLGVLLKRIFSKELRYLSDVDDYTSNIIVTNFQIASALTMFCPFCHGIQLWLLLSASIVFFYIPIGKLRHIFFFFAARIQLGKFFGKRGVWQLKKEQNEQE